MRAYTFVTLCGRVRVHKCTSSLAIRLLSVCVVLESDEHASQSNTMDWPRDRKVRLRHR